MSDAAKDDVSQKRPTMKHNVEFDVSASSMEDLSNGVATDPIIRGTGASSHSSKHPGFLLSVGQIRTWIIRNGVFALAVIIPLLVAYGTALGAHIKRASNPFVFNDDVRQQVFPFFQFHEAGLFPNDYFAKYYLTCFLPSGYSAFYRLGARVADPASISKLLPYLLLTITVIAVAFSVRQLAGYLGGLVAAGLVLSQGIFLGHMAGGLPRAFAFPSVALVAAALVYGRPRLLAGIVCGSVGFYPVAAMLGAIALMLWLFVLPASDRGEAGEWTLSRRLRLVIITASISALILFPVILGARAYGRMLGPRDVPLYPELGVGGRYAVERMVLRFDTFPQTLIQVVREFFKPVGKPWSQNVRDWANNASDPGTKSHSDVILSFVAIAVVAGIVLVTARNVAGRRLLLLIVAAWLGYVAARSLAPYFFLPDRYVMYAVPILLVCLIPTAGAAIGAQLCSRRLVRLGRSVGVIVISVMVLLPFGGRGSTEAGLNTDVESQRRLYDFLGGLPKDVVIAGWPTDIDNVPYVSRRQVFISYELHQVLHQTYADEMRRRMQALIDAYFAADQKALERLRGEFGVTHLIFQQSRLEEPPTYFRPFSVWARKAFNEGRGRGFEIPRQIPAATVFSDGTFVVLDLRRLKPQ